MAWPRDYGSARLSAASSRTHNLPGDSRTFATPACEETTSDFDTRQPDFTVNTIAMPQASKSNKPAAGKVGGQGRSAIEDVVAREYTIHMHKRVRSV